MPLILTAASRSQAVMRLYPRLRPHKSRRYGICYRYAAAPLLQSPARSPSKSRRTTFVWMRLTSLGCDQPRFQVFSHAVARIARHHPKLRSIMSGDDRVREYHNVNLGLALARPNDRLSIAVIRGADKMTLAEFVRACTSADACCDSRWGSSSR